MSPTQPGTVVNLAEVTADGLLPVDATAARQTSLPWELITAIYEASVVYRQEQILSFMVYDFFRRNPSVDVLKKELLPQNQ